MNENSNFPHQKDYDIHSKSCFLPLSGVNMTGKQIFREFQNFDMIDKINWGLNFGLNQKIVSWILLVTTFTNISMQQIF